MTEEDIREDAKLSLMIEIFYARDVLEKITIPEDRIKEEYESLKDRLIFPEKVIVIDAYFLEAVKVTMKKLS